MIVVHSQPSMSPTQISNAQNDSIQDEWIDDYFITEGNPFTGWSNSEIWFESVPPYRQFHGYFGGTADATLARVFSCAQQSKVTVEALIGFDDCDCFFTDIVNISSNGNHQATLFRSLPPQPPHFIWFNGPDGAGCGKWFVSPMPPLILNNFPPTPATFDLKFDIITDNPQCDVIIFNVTIECDQISPSTTSYYLFYSCPYILSITILLN